MKTRIKIDNSILIVAIMGTVILFFCKKIYLTNLFFDNLLDFFGFMFIFDGIFCRMVARAYKKNFSFQGHQLVTTGLYALTRNPMYLGSFLVGIGFALMVWPWWSLPIFAWLFLKRFKYQILKEENWLQEKFKEEYQAYCQKVPQIFPSCGKLVEVDIKEILDLKQAFSTKEKRGLLFWPILALGMELAQEILVYQRFNPVQIFLILLSSAGVYFIFISVLGKRS